MDTVQVETINPHQYRQKERTIGERYDADAVHLPLIKFMQWAKPVDAKPVTEELSAQGPKPKQQFKRNK